MFILVEIRGVLRDTRENSFMGYLDDDGDDGYYNR
jgi:hypothetical protein